ncbi:radical SAM protein [Actinoplanes sp. NPDC024001]|uniref:radical SAM protein n=1 Tax=Actinoplanes sp. NPDC024001 TaxID=3154598 RepID=UPI0033FF1BA4
MHIDAEFEWPANPMLAPDLESLPPHIWIRLHDRHQVQRRLRVSLTDNCNFGCFFCHNEGQGPLKPARMPTLSGTEIVSLVRIALSEGVTKVKLTGGEPLLYRDGPDDVVALVGSLAALRRAGPAFDLSVTTNGSLLPRFADRLAAAGLDRVTMSMTTVDDSTFGRLIASNPRLLDLSLAGLAAARDAGLKPLKLNMALYHSAERSLGNMGELHRILDIATAHDVSELRLFTLLWHDDFPAFQEFYQFFSPYMRAQLTSLLRQCDVVAPSETVEILSRLAVSFADRLYPKVEFGVDLGYLKIGFEAMKFGRLANRSKLQEGPYAMRIAADGTLRATLSGPAHSELIDGVRSGRCDEELRLLYRKAVEEMP